MKLAVALVLALGAFACGGKKSSNTTVTDQNSTMQPAGGSTYGGKTYGGAMGGNTYGGSKYGGTK